VDALAPAPTPRAAPNAAVKIPTEFDDEPPVAWPPEGKGDPQTMNTFAPQDLLAQQQWRYATKKFDPTRAIPDGAWSALEQTLVLTPSSHGMQPWKFLVIDSRDVRAKLAAITWGDQLMACSRYVVLARRNNFGKADVARVVDSISAIRGTPRSDLATYEKDVIGEIASTSTLHHFINDWASLQVYLALGNFLCAAAALGIDTCPVEGAEFGGYDEILGLTAQGYSSVVACAAGYRAADDDYAQEKKVRFPVNEVVEHR
jgi:nitroreductase